ncbi:MAG: hypoxanthine-guanine-xanthine phosphoribosyltransferase [Candidatus Scalindua rubra]|uniref:Hypoxanthine phosphoribosyltransferase n=1 Tax=Candidatus Scalindua rubra TaxID=1872076 RepID=A0A1E3X6V7_9BACT|nr:MAG: hypoxanthine-guanine-xanthine phosphoribosyltransferase [Candidatus Scalindua rubra]
MKKNIEKVLITETEIRNKVKELAQRLAVDYEHKSLTIISILNGSLIFLSDLIRHIPFPVKIDTIRVNTYIGDSKVPKGEADIINNISLDIKDEHVLIVDDILDTGKTLSKIVQVIKKHNPLSLKVCILLNKIARREVEIVPDYCCFEIEDKFVVGYGLDFDNKYRNLPYIAVLKEGCYNCSVK